MTILDAFDPPVVTAPTQPAAAELKIVAAVKPKKAAKVGPSAAVRAAATIRADLSGAWLWDAHGQTVRSLWDARIPAVERVPGSSQVLRSAWIAYNHAVLLVLVPLMFVFWVLGHPARLLYALPIGAPLLALWLI